MRLWRVCVCGGCAGLTAIMVSACGPARAKTTPDVPPLQMPAPPPRAVEPNETETLPPAPIVEEPERRMPSRPTRPPVRPEAPRIESPRHEVTKTETAKPAEEPKQPTTLQTTPISAEAEMERAVRGLLTRATGDLNRIDRRALNADARTQYDTAKRFVAQAEEALKSRNLVFATNLADKAATLAAQLAGRSR